MSEHNEVKAIICPNCGKLISGTAESCMHCGMKNPSMWGLSEHLRKFFGGQTSLIPIISTFCVTLYLLSLILDIRSISGLIQPGHNVLVKLGMSGLAAIIKGHWWTLITAIYLHGNILHIMFNMMWIRQLGPQVEDLFGISRSFVIFTVAGAVGFLFSSFAFVISPKFVVGFTLGASGSIFGLLGALVFYGKKRGGAFGTAIYRQTGQWAIVLFIFGFLFPGVDNFAHAGGFIGGYLAANALGFTELKRESRNHQLLAFVLIVMTILSFILAFIN